MVQCSDVRTVQCSSGGWCSGVSTMQWSSSGAV